MIINKKRHNIFLEKTFQSNIFDNKNYVDVIERQKKRQFLNQKLKKNLNVKPLRNYFSYKYKKFYISEKFNIFLVKMCDSYNSIINIEIAKIPAIYY